MIPQKALVNPLLENQFFKRPGVQRRLASYPSADIPQKNILFIELMEELWRLPGRPDSLFPVFRDFDADLTRIGRKGHFVHQFEVFLLGWHLINQLLKIGSDSPLHTMAKSDISKLFTSWLFTSTPHDLGYPIQAAKELTKGYEDGYRAIYSKHISKRYKRLLKDYSIRDEDDLINVPFVDTLNFVEGIIDIERFLNRGISMSLEIDEKEANQLQVLLLEERNHGYVSALILCRAYISYMSEHGIWNVDDERWRMDMLRLAASAVALHAIPMEHHGFIRELSFQSNFLGYLLFLIDNLHEWNRSFNEHKKYPSYDLLDFMSTDSNLSLQYQLTHSKWSPNMENTVKTFLSEKQERIELPRKYNPAFGFNIKADFRGSNDQDFGSIQLEL